LIAGLVLLALLPNLTVAAFVWLPALWTDAPDAKVESPAREEAAAMPAARPKEAAKTVPALTVPPILEASAGEDIVLPIALDGTDGVPFRSAIAISGLPAGATLSNGRPYGAAGWNLQPDEIGDLHLAVPDAASGDARLHIELVDPAGEIITAAETTLRVAVKPAPAPAPPPAPEAAAPSSDPGPAIKEARAEPAAQDTAANPVVTAGGAQPDTAADTAAADDNGQSAPSDGGEKRSAANEAVDPSKLAPSDGEEEAADAANSVRPSTSVNLRDGPTSSATVVAVIAKDTELKVLEQKRHWVKVTNPETSESGWVYAPNLKGLPKSRGWSAQSDPPDAPSKSRESIWKRMRNWLTGG
jgi:hypothetical protein